MNGDRGSSRTLAAGLLVLVAALGVLGGIVLDRTILPHHTVHGDAAAFWGAERPPDRRVRNRVLQHITARMTEELELSADQRERLATVLERQEERLSEAMAEARPRIDEILNQTHRQIGEILSAEQRERFERMWMLHHGPPAQ